MLSRANGDDCPYKAEMLVSSRSSLSLSLIVGSAMLVLAACAGHPPGYSKTEPGLVICGCDYPDACYDAAAQVDKKGETDATAEDLLYYSQCACFLGNSAACNMLGHFTRDNIRWCEAGENVANTCATAGFIYHHGVQLPHYAGRSFDRDEAKAKAGFAKACAAGSRIACAAPSQ